MQKFIYRHPIATIGKSIINVPAEIGSLIYFGENPALLNQMQERALKKAEARKFYADVLGLDELMNQVCETLSKSW